MRELLDGGPGKWPTVLFSLEEGRGTVVAGPVCTPNVCLCVPARVLVVWLCDFIHVFFSLSRQSG